MLGTWNAQLRRLVGQCLGFVVVPDYVQAIAWFAERGQLSEFMKQWKRTSSLRIRLLLSTTLAAYVSKVGESPVWPARYYGFNIYNRRKMEEKLSYRHLNPVRTGLVREACQWRWSSAGHYELGKSVGVKVGWIEQPCCAYGTPTYVGAT